MLLQFHTGSPESTAGSKAHPIAADEPCTVAMDAAPSQSPLQSAGATAGTEEGSASPAYKFTIRANVMVVGRTAVLVHGEPILHCATEAYQAPDPNPRSTTDGDADTAGDTGTEPVSRMEAARRAHITNHSERHGDAEYDRLQHTQSLGEAIRGARLGQMRLCDHSGKAISPNGLLWKDGSPASQSVEEGVAEESKHGCGTGAGPPGAKRSISKEVLDCPLF